jgi:hypothetical protein
MSYHARAWEGGCSIFLVPSTAEVILVDQGRSTPTISFYRNQVGDTFKEASKWDNFYLSDETGGIKVMQQL